MQFPFIGLGWDAGVHAHQCAGEQKQQVYEGLAYHVLYANLNFARVDSKC